MAVLLFFRFCALYALYLGDRIWGDLDPSVFPRAIYILRVYYARLLSYILGSALFFLTDAGDTNLPVGTFFFADFFALSYAAIIYFVKFYLLGEPVSPKSLDFFVINLDNCDVFLALDLTFFAWRTFMVIFLAVVSFNGDVSVTSLTSRLVYESSRGNLFVALAEASECSELFEAALYKGAI